MNFLMDEIVARWDLFVYKFATKSLQRMCEKRSH